jgi:hypothetical protein
MKNILLILLFCQQLYAQNTIKNLVFEGAGVRGIAYAGAITAMMIDFIGVLLSANVFKFF